MPLSREERYLAMLAMEPDKDWSLDRLAALADDGAGLGVTFLLDSGYVVTGQLGRTVDWAEHVDTILGSGLEQAENTARQEGRTDDANNWQKFRKTVSESSLKSEAERSVEARKQLYEKTDGTPTNDLGRIDLDQIEDPDTVERVIQFAQRRPTVTLKDAVMKPPVGSAQHVPGEGIIRVLTSHIAAWWPGRSGFEGFEDEQFQPGQAQQSK